MYFEWTKNNTGHVWDQQGVHNSRGNTNVAIQTFSYTENLQFLFDVESKISRNFDKVRTKCTPTPHGLTSNTLTVLQWPLTHAGGRIGIIAAKRTSKWRCHGINILTIIIIIHNNSQFMLLQSCSFSTKIDPWWCRKSTANPDRSQKTSVRYQRKINTRSWITVSLSDRYVFLFCFFYQSSLYMDLMV